MEFTPTDPNGNAVMADVCGAAMKSDTLSAALQMKPLTAVPAALHTIKNKKNEKRCCHYAPHPI